MLRFCGYAAPGGRPLRGREATACCPEAAPREDPHPAAVWTANSIPPSVTLAGVPGPSFSQVVGSVDVGAPAVAVAAPL